MQNLSWTGSQREGGERSAGLSQTPFITHLGRENWSWKEPSTVEWPFWESETDGDRFLTKIGMTGGATLSDISTTAWQRLFFHVIISRLADQSLPKAWHSLLDIHTRECGQHPI